MEAAKDGLGILSLALSLVYKSIVPQTNNLAAIVIERTEEAATKATVRYIITASTDCNLKVHACTARPD